MHKPLIFIVFLCFSTAQASTLAWQIELAEENSWSRVTFAGTLLVASEKDLSHFDPQTGELLWQREDLTKLAQFSVRDVAGSPFLVISKRIGNVPPKSRLQVLNITTGETLWDTGELAGTGLGVFAVPDRDLLIYVADLQAKDAGNYVVGYSLATGEERWRTKLGRMGILPTHRSDISGFIPTMDLNGHPPPLFVDVSAGALVWKWTKAKNSVTNIRVDAERGLVLLADKKKLYGLDLNASKKGKVAFAHELEFKRKMGNADMAAKGLGAASGLLSGGLAGGLKGLGGGGDRGDPPLDIEMIGDQLVVQLVNKPGVC